MVLSNLYGICCCSLQETFNFLSRLTLKESIFLEFSWEIRVLRVHWEFISRFISSGTGNAFSYGRLGLVPAGHPKSLSFPKHFTEGMCILPALCMSPGTVPSLDCSAIPFLTQGIILINFPNSFHFETLPYWFSYWEFMELLFYRTKLGKLTNRHENWMDVIMSLQD